ncbi:amylase cluster transcriptional regulator AmyR [Paecilomyces variotii No. 5]|uniref:Amylase cluster transcriptional regulator AmyR n=1 Tax=Byssochlamys spectabilis (strain No. 5 / NBRC 109023) TaxID=1356009 RepID=V5G0V8_BYSSN|nr:amylase cluster transcriptional regulator AmyR [Paecilomyces variotii No. 5]
MNSPPASAQKLQRQACDNCRRRKIKCNRANPCDKCQRLLLSCTYAHVLQRKGPKFRRLYPLAPLHAGDYQSPAYYTQRGESNNPYNEGSTASSTWSGERGRLPPDLYQQEWRSCSPPGSISSPESLSLQHESDNAQLRPHARRLSSMVLLAHANVFLKYLFPIMPVVHREQLLSDSAEPLKLSPQRYAFMASLCAATHIQLNLDGDGSMNDPPEADSSGTHDPSPTHGEALLAEAVRARAELDIPSNVNIESILTSFFLFAAYGNLDKGEHAWFYLSQSISMVHMLSLHLESTYSTMDVVDAEESRRVFWLLFVTERAYALQRSRPVSLRNSIEKPKVLYADDPILAYGFLNLIHVFETLTVNLYDWVSTGCDSRYSEVPPTRIIQSNLSNPITLDGVLEIQQVDILITQQWLQAKMWTLSLLGHGHSSSPQQSMPLPTGGPVLPFHLPVLVGKAVMNVIGAVSQGALDAHGIGMEQKLFDLGTSIADVACSLRLAATQRLAAAIIDPRELLWGMLTTLSKIRGSQSYLFPELLERSRSILGLDTPHTLTDMEASSESLSWGVNNNNTERSRTDANVSNDRNCEVEDRAEDLTLGLDSALSDETSVSITDIPFLA